MLPLAWRVARDTPESLFYSSCYSSFDSCQSNESSIKSLKPNNAFNCLLCFPSWKALSSIHPSYRSTYSRIAQPSLWKLHFSCSWGPSPRAGRAGLTLCRTMLCKKLLALALESSWVTCFLQSYFVFTHSIKIIRHVIRYTHWFWKRWTWQKGSYW